MVGIPKSIVSALREHIATYVQDEPGALLFPGAKGEPLRRSGFNTRTRWVDVVKEIGVIPHRVKTHRTGLSRTFSKRLHGSAILVDQPTTHLPGQSDLPKRVPTVNIPSATPSGKRISR
ncbi:hypothetical protein [Microtetraspora glauca]|uniref:Tyr recombinase domain-containing protein n=1 Tax=Microtetraspora glauca TaxID=1996 RepID=A0ABV3GNV2_MICGL